MSTTVARKEGYSQVCVWPGTLVGKDKVEAFEQFMLDKFGARVQYLEEITTNPDPGSPGTGGRNDAFFAVHSEDIGKFAVPRLMVGIRWIEDVYGNGQGYLYPERVKEYKTWDCGDGQDEDDEDDEDE